MLKLFILFCAAFLSPSVLAQTANPLFVISVNDKKGFINKTGTVVIEPRFESARSFAEGLAAAKNSDNKWGYVDETGKWVIEPQFTNAMNFSEGLARTQVGGGKYGLSSE